MRREETALDSARVSARPIDYGPLLDRMKVQNELRRLVKADDYEQVIVCDHLVVPLDDRCEG